MILFLILASTFVVCLISLIGIFAFVIREKVLERFLFCLIGFSAGVLIGAAFLHLLPEALETTKSTLPFYYVITGIVLFFFMERYLHWRHCHEPGCSVHEFTYLNLFGNSLHNFTDGMVIAGSFVVSVKLGFITTLAIIVHEIPHELGDFAVLVYGGFSKKKALMYNFISAFAAMFGALAGYFLSNLAGNFSSLILPIAAGGFIYIATSDLIPEIHKESNVYRSTAALVAFLLGIILMALAKHLLPC